MSVTQIAKRLELLVFFIGTLIQEFLDLEFLLANTMSLVSMNLSRPYFLIRQANPGNSLQLPPAALSEFHLQPINISDGS